MRLAAPLVSGAALACSRRNRASWYSSWNSVVLRAPNCWRSLKNARSSDLLTQRDAGPQFPGLRRRRNLEQIQIERLADRLAERRGDEAGGDAACGRGERRSLAACRAR